MIECKYIDKIGFELEGAWKKPRNLVGDDSFGAADFPPIFAAIGEFVSKPYDSKEEVFKAIKENYPDGAMYKCGFHVHVSLHNASLYSSLMSRKFYDFFLRRMKEWARAYNCTNELFWQRLNGENRYCRRRFNPDAQARYEEKGHNRLDRRDHFNYCYGLRKTVECRMFPVFVRAETAISVVDAYINCIEEYLDTNPPSREVFRVDFIDADCNKVSSNILNAEIEEAKVRISNAENEYEADEWRQILHKLVQDASGQEEKNAFYRIFGGPKRFRFNYYEQDPFSGQTVAMPDDVRRDEFETYWSFTDEPKDNGTINTNGDYITKYDGTQIAVKKDEKGNYYLDTIINPIKPTALPEDTYVSPKQTYEHLDSLYETWAARRQR